MFEKENPFTVPFLSIVFFCTSISVIVVNVMHIYILELCEIDIFVG